MMNFRKYLNLKFSRGFSLLEALAAIALSGIIIITVLNLLTKERATTWEAHAKIAPLLLAKNYLYETERTLKKNEHNKNPLTRTIEKTTLTLSSTLIKQEGTQLEIILVTAINDLGKIKIEDHLFVARAVRPPELKQETPS